jgi:hypothetical protein
MKMHGSQNAVTATERAVTINERLSKALSTLSFQCDRLEAVLSRVNGTPSKLEQATKSNGPAPILSMQANLEHLEGHVERLIELASGVERIA